MSTPRERAINALRAQGFTEALLIIFTVEATGLAVVDAGEYEAMRREHKMLVERLPFNEAMKVGLDADEMQTASPPLCFECGSMMVAEREHYRCLNCGTLRITSKV